MAVAGFRCNSSLDLEVGCRAHQGHANPLSLESNNSDRLCSTQYLHPRAELGGFYEIGGRFTKPNKPLTDDQLVFTQRGPLRVTTWRIFSFSILFQKLSGTDYSAESLRPDYRLAESRVGAILINSLFGLRLGDPFQTIQRMRVGADAEVLDLLGQDCPMDNRWIPRADRPSLEGCLGQRFFGSWVNSSSAPTTGRNYWLWIPRRYEV